MSPISERGPVDEEAHKYWGYLFKTDKTGTDKLKKLLRALHRHIGRQYDPYDSTDLTPAQLAHFYRDLNGNYDPLFLSVPPGTIQYIYKNLGCLHSLQPATSAATSNRFIEATIPALKEQGWIMWETIQLLLGPEEHASFLMQAVSKWDLKDPETGELFPKVLPRTCFPTLPDAHMTAWYEGVSERLRREADEEQSVRVIALEEEPRKQIEAAARPHRKSDREQGHESDSEPVTEKKSALAYFRNPLFRNHEGRPGVVRRGSKHPTLISRGKSAATTVGQTLLNIGSPHLWDGDTTPKSETHSHKERTSHRDRDHKEHRESHHREHRERERDRDRRRKSLPHAHFRGSDEDDQQSPKVHPRQAALNSRRGSAANSPASDREHGGAESDSPRYTPTERERHHHRQHSSPAEHTLRTSKSHDPSTSSNKGYFPPYDSYHGRRGSAHNELNSPDSVPVQSPGSRTPVSEVSSHRERDRERDRVRDREREREKNAERRRDTDPLQQAGFMPTASPLFATHVARTDFHGGPHQFSPPNYLSRAERYESPARSSTGRTSSARGTDRRALRVDSGRGGVPPAGSQGSPPGTGYTSASPPGGATGIPASYARSKATRYDAPVEAGDRRRYARDAYR